MREPVVFVLVDGKLKGAIALADIVRPEAKQAIEALKALNIRCMMLTGDNKATAKWVSDQIGLDEYFAEVLPQENALGGLVACWLIGHRIPHLGYHAASLWNHASYKSPPFCGIDLIGACEAMNGHVWRQADGTDHETEQDAGDARIRD